MRGRWTADTPRGDSPSASRGSRRGGSLTGRFDHVADVVVVGAGGAGLPASITARDHGASVICLEANSDVGGHAILSGGLVPLGGGTSWQRRFGIEDSADQVYRDYSSAAGLDPRFARSLLYSDRELVRVWADESAATFEFLLENDVTFIEEPPAYGLGHLPGAVPRLVVARPFSDDFAETINGLGGSGIARPLERSARRKGVVFLLGHTLTGLITDTGDGRVLAITAAGDGREISICARRGVILATGGHTSNVDLRRMFDPRLTAEYQTAGEPWTQQTGDGELLAMEIGAALWGTASQASGWSTITKTLHIGCRWGYRGLKWDPRSPVFEAAGASGLTVADFQDVILVNQTGNRIWNEIDDSKEFIDACLGASSEVGATNGGGPIWAIFDSEAVRRERWNPNSPSVDPNGWFFSAGTLRELAAKVENPYQRAPIPPSALEATLDRYNALVDCGVDLDFGRPSPAYRIEKPPFYAAWATPILHDSLTGLRIDTSCRVIDLRGRVIAGLFCAGESAGGFGHHGLARALVFGRIAGRAAARLASS